MAELADALDLGSSIFGCGGSTPPSRTFLRAGMKIVERMLTLQAYDFFYAFLIHPHYTNNIRGNAPWNTASTRKKIGLQPQA